MTSRDYTKEVGIHSEKKSMSRPVALGILAAVAIGVSFGVAGILSRAKEYHQTEKPATASAAAVPTMAPAGAAPAVSAPTKH